MATDSAIDNDLVTVEWTDRVTGGHSHANGRKEHFYAWVNNDKKVLNTERWWLSQRRERTKVYLVHTGGHDLSALSQVNPDHWRQGAHFPISLATVEEGGVGKERDSTRTHSLTRDLVQRSMIIPLTRNAKDFLRLLSKKAVIFKWKS